MDNFPEKAGVVFEILTSNKPGFLCDNSNDRDIQKLYNVVEESFDVLSEYFARIGFLLRRGNGYYYFSKDFKRTEIADRLERVLRFIDIVDFFKSYDSSFTAYSTFTVASIVQKCQMQIGLKQKLQDLNKSLPHQKENLTDIAEGVVTLLENQFIELEDEDERRYKVLSSFRYLEDLFARIVEEDSNEDVTSDLLHQ
ncbi:hypothetical protein U14_05725 [Candidatus Moduliflexus flocculans]|uniref:Uncharacterized protein n=1 Tax=Candidatus Moduliflexus flocculans TaxID=1499966 RepID=A0A081BSQ9_9BACT|nr:hypothetical protein U14_05725 [Candidatus Moduliflexus flocculans]